MEVQIFGTNTGHNLNKLRVVQGTYRVWSYSKTIPFHSPYNDTYDIPMDPGLLVNVPVVVGRTTAESTSIFEGSGVFGFKVGTSGNLFFVGVEALDLHRSCFRAS